MSGEINYSDAERVGLLLAMFSPMQRDGIVSAILTNSGVVRATANDMSERTSHTIDRGFNFLDAVSKGSLGKVIIGAISAFRAERALTALDSKRAIKVAEYLNVPSSEIIASIPKDDDIEKLVKASLTDASKRKAAAAAKNLKAAAAIIKPSVRANMILPFYFFLGKALESTLEVKEMIIDANIAQIEIGDPTSEEGEAYDKVAAQEIGDTFEQGLPFMGAALSVGRGLFGKMKGWRKRRKARREQVVEQAAGDKNLEADLGTAAQSQQPGAVKAAEDYLSASAKPDEAEPYKATQRVEFEEPAIVRASADEE